MRIIDDSIFRSERFLEGLERVLEAWGGAKAAPRGANKYLSADFGSPDEGPGNLLSKTGVLARVHEIQKSIWRYCTSENGDCRLNTRLDVCKLQKFSNRSGACIVAKTVIFRLAAVTGVALQKQSERQPGGMRRPGGGVRGGKPPRGNRWTNVSLHRRHVSVGYGGFKRFAHSAGPI